MGGTSDADHAAVVTTAAEPPDRLAAMERAFAEALGRHRDALREETYEIAGRAVRLRVVGRRLAMRTHRAFAHLRQAGAAPAPRLSIDVWDEEETGVPFLPHAADTELERRWIACDGTITASAGGRYVSFRYQESVTILDRRAQRMVSCRRSGSHLSSGEVSKPYVLMLSVWLHDRAVQVLHCGLVARRGAGVLLPGVSGTGKSTTAITAATQGLDFLGDDFIGLEHRDGREFLGHSLFATACLTRGTLERLPALRADAVADDVPGEEKPIVFVSELYPARMRSTVPLRALALVRIRQPRTEILPARRAEALRALAASTLHTVVPRPGREALERMGALAEQVPAFWLHLGPDLEDIGPAIDRILSQVGHGDGG